MKQRFSFFCLAACLLAGPGLIPTIGHAADDVSNLRITGTIVAQTCDVVSSSQNQTVNIGDFATTDFPASGSTGAEKSFTINLTGCTAGIAGAKVMFSGTADATNPQLLALSDTGGGETMATGIAVEILDGHHQPVTINNADSSLYLLQAGDNPLRFYLRYKSTADTVTAGNATAVMYFDLQYQ